MSASGITTQQRSENKRSLITAAVLIVGCSLLLIGLILLMRALFMPKPQYNGNSATGQFEADQEGEFYQTQQNVSEPDSPAEPQTDDNQQ